MAQAEVKPMPDEALEKKAIYENSQGISVNLSSEIPQNHKWFKGEFHTSAWGSESSPFAGASKSQVRVSMLGKEISPTIRNGVASVYGVVSAVSEPEDRDLIGSYGWWKLKDLSKTSHRRRRRI